MSESRPPLPQYRARPPKSKGCFFYGCLGLAVAGLVGLVALYFGYLYVSKLPDKLITQYTDTNAMDLVHVELSGPQLQKVQERIENFSQALENPTNTAELTLSADEINGLIAAQQRGTNEGTGVLVRIEDDRLKGDVSIPFKEDLGPFNLKGRYLNGAATFKVGMANGELDVRLDGLEVNNQPLPALLLAELRKKNLADEAKANDPELRSFLEKIGSVKIEDGKIIIRNRGLSPPGDSAP